MTTSAFKPLTAVEQVFKSLIWDPLINAGETWLDVEVPLLALPIIKQIGDFAIGELTDAIFNQIILIIDVGAIKLVSAEVQSAYDTASESLVIIVNEKGANSDEYKKAQADALQTLSRFVHLIGS